MRMRVALAGIAALVLVPAAAASRPPIGSGEHPWLGAAPPTVLDRPQSRTQASCSAHARRSPGFIERKLAPVACEQPPRPNLLVVTAIASFIP